MNNDRAILIDILSPDEALPAEDARGVRAGPMADYLLELRHHVSMMQSANLRQVSLIRDMTETIAVLRDELDEMRLELQTRGAI